MEEESSSGRLACKMCMTSYTLTLVDDYNTGNHNHLHVQNRLEVEWAPGNMFRSTQKHHWMQPQPSYTFHEIFWVKGMFTPAPHAIFTLYYISHIFLIKETMSSYFVYNWVFPAHQFTSQECSPPCLIYITNGTGEPTYDCLSHLGKNKRRYLNKTPKPLPCKKGQQRAVSCSPVLELRCPLFQSPQTTYLMHSGPAPSQHTQTDKIWILQVFYVG